MDRANCKKIWRISHCKSLMTLKVMPGGNRMLVCAAGKTLTREKQTYEYPFFCKHNQNNSHANADITIQDNDGEGKPCRFFRCSICRRKITSSENTISVNGNHRHVFANPHGKIYEIGCFACAPGCINHGPPTMECTWFAGCSWRFSLCATCSTHLGWHYQSNLGGSFFGLILANLVFC